MSTDIEKSLRDQLRAITHERNVLASDLIAAQSDHATAVEALRDLIEAIEHTPLGVRAIKALERARAAANPQQKGE